MKNLLTILCLALTFHLHSQDFATIDSTLNTIDAEDTSTIHKTIEMVQLSKKLGYTKGEARALHKLGYTYYNMRSYGMALKKYKEAIRLREITGETEWQAMLMVNCSYVYHVVKDFKMEISYAENALKIAKTDTIKSYVHLSLGKGYIANQEYVKGIESLKESVKYQKASGDVSTLWKNYIEIGNAYLLVGQYDSAISVYRQIESLQADPNALSLMYTVLGVANHSKGNFNEAEMYYRRGISYGVKNDLGTAYLNLAELTYMRGEKVLASQCLDSAVKYPHTLEHLAKTLEVMDRSKESISTYKKLVSTIVKDYELLIPYHSDVVNAEYKMMYEDQLAALQEASDWKSKVLWTWIAISVVTFGLLGKYLWDAKDKIKEYKFSFTKIRAKIQEAKNGPIL